MNKVLSIIDVINALRRFYFFDIIASDCEKITFLKRGKGNLYLSSESLIKLSDNSYLKQTEIPDEHIISKLSINFIDRFNNDDHSYCYV
ncbi:phage tail protein [Rickettsia akari]|uniref:phage tail protein n=1 Tax=Rickettsia akari TaxID=786 RepID=UPI00031ABABB|nr:phage tail protein [Rickettsia akari]